MSDPTEAPTAPAARIEVVAGGTPSDAELAALTVALTPTGGADAPDPETGGAGVPAWARAALLENVGQRRPTRPSDLDALARLG